MAVKRRTIWLSDEEWALLNAQAKEHGDTVSGVIRDMWQLAAKAEPNDPETRNRVIASATADLGRNPYAEFNPAPKTKGK